MEMKIQASFFILFFFLVISCSETQPGISEDERPDFEQVPLFELEEVFSVSSFDDGNFFAQITTVTEAVDGTIFVSDPQARKLYMFDRDGNYLGFLGGAGEGPGEFRQIGALTWLESDTFQVYDWEMARITLISNQNGVWGPVRYFDRPQGAREYGSDIYFTFSNLYPHPDGYLARFSSSFTPVDTSRFNFAYYTLFDQDLKPADNREYNMYLESGAIVNRVPGSSVSVMSIPEAHRMLFHITSDGLKINTWTGSNRILIQKIVNEGSDTAGFLFTSRRVHISTNEKDEIAKERIPNPENATITRERLINYIPDYRGLARQLIVDDHDRIWILTHPFEEGDPEWLIYNMDGELLGAAHHPGGRVTQILENRLYLVKASDDEEPSFGLYEIVKIN